MRITIDIDDEYMYSLAKSLGTNPDQCTMEGIGLLKWAVDMRLSGKIIYLCDCAGGSPQRANIPILDKAKRV